MRVCGGFILLLPGSSLLWSPCISSLLCDLSLVTVLIVFGIVFSILF